MMHNLALHDLAHDVLDPHLRSMQASEQSNTIQKWPLDSKQHTSYIGAAPQLPTGLCQQRHVRMPLPPTQHSGPVASALRWRVSTAILVGGRSSCLLHALPFVMVVPGQMFALHLRHKLSPVNRAMPLLWMLSTRACKTPW